MNGFAFAALGAGGLAAATLALASPAVSAPSGPGSAQGTVDSLRGSGYHVVLNRLGTTSMDKWTVTGIRKGTPVTVAVDPIVMRTTVYVDLKC
jgi:hypothetical protein